MLAMLSGCNGGSTSSNVLLPATDVVSSASAAKPRSTPSPYPWSNGEVVRYAGMLTQRFQNFPEVVPPGTPSPEPISVTRERVSQTIAIRTQQSFNGGTRLTDLHDEESDAYTSGLKTTTHTTDTYEKAGSPPSQLVNYGSQYVDESGDTMTTSYAPPRVENELPERAGAQWSNGAGAQVLEALAGDKKGSPVTVSRTVDNDGTYNESTTYPLGYSGLGYTGIGQIQENVDGSGTYAFVTTNAPTTIDYSAPVPQPTGRPRLTIAVYDQLDPTPSDKPSSLNTLASWYGASPAFYNEIDRDLGKVTVPAACALSAKFPKAAIAVQETVDTTDTVLGYTEHQVETSYVAAGYGVLCSVLSDKQTLYYDFNGDEPYVFTNAPPLEIATLSETLALQPTSHTAKATSAAVTSSSGAIVGDVAPALRLGFEHAVETLRRHRAERLLKALLTARERGVSR